MTSLTTWGGVGVVTNVTSMCENAFVSGIFRAIFRRTLSLLAPVNGFVFPSLVCVDGALERCLVHPSGA